MTNKTTNTNVGASFLSSFFQKQMIVLRITNFLNADEFVSNFALKFCEQWLDFNFRHE